MEAEAALPSGAEWKRGTAEEKLELQVEAVSATPQAVNRYSRQL